MLPARTAATHTVPEPPHAAAAVLAPAGLAHQSDQPAARAPGRAQSHAAGRLGVVAQLPERFA